MKAVPNVVKTVKASVSEICSAFGLTRDAFYKLQKRLKKKESVSDHVLELVKEERKEQPREGTRKLHETLQSTFI